MPPILRFLSSNPAPGTLKAYGSFSPDQTASKTIATGLTLPIACLYMVYVDSGNNHNYWHKAVSMPGRLCVGGVGVLGTGIIEREHSGALDGVGFVNGGVDFDVRDDDEWALNTLNLAGVFHWVAWS